MHAKTPRVIIQGNITAMRYRNDVIRSVLLHRIRANLGRLLAWQYASYHTTRSTLVTLVANNVHTLRWLQKFKSYRPLVETQGSYTADATKSQWARERVLFIRCVWPFHNSIFIDTCYQWVHGTLLYQVDVLSVEKKLNTTWFDFAFFCF